MSAPVNLLAAVGRARALRALARADALRAERLDHMVAVAPRVVLTPRQIVSGRWLLAHGYSPATSRFRGAKALPAAGKRAAARVRKAVAAASFPDHPGLQPRDSAAVAARRGGAVRRQAGTDLTLDGGAS